MLWKALTDSRGSVSASHLTTLVVVGLAGLGGMGALGGAMGRAIGDESTAATATLVGTPPLAVSREAGLGSTAGRAVELFAAGSEKVATVSKVGHDASDVAAAARKLTRLAPDPVVAARTHVAGALYSAEEVSTLRDVAHQLWRQSQPNYVGARYAVDGRTGFATVKLGDRTVRVGATPRMTDPEVVATIPKSGSASAEEAAEILAQQQTWLTRLEEAVDRSFARGHTGTTPGKRVPFSGVDVNQRFQPGMWRPDGVWQVHVHGSAESFGKPTRYTINELGKHSESEWVTVTAGDIVKALEEEGYTRGEPILLSSCSAGACSNTGESAAQKLADAADAPVVAPSATHYREAEGAVYLRQQESKRFGEWRLFQPESWRTTPDAKRVVMGRQPLANEDAVASVNELWHYEPKSLERVELAGDWERFGEDNEGALSAAYRALAENGRLVIRATGKPETEDFVVALRSRGFDVKQAIEGDHATLIATRRSAADVAAAEELIRSRFTAYSLETHKEMNLWVKMLALQLTPAEIAGLSNELLVISSLPMPTYKSVIRFGPMVYINPAFGFRGMSRVQFAKLIRRTVLGAEKVGDGSSVKRAVPLQVQADLPMHGPARPSLL